MATNFPNSPSNGATHTFGGTVYTYNSTKGVWKAAAGEAVTISDTPPSNPGVGDLWFDSSVAKTYIYYNDGSSNQWVQMNPSGGSDGADGADGSTGGESPVILTEPPTTTQELNSDGTTSTVTMTAQDPEGFDITYGIAYKTTGNTRPSQLSADTTINQSTGVYTFTPTTTTSNAGSFRARLSASDGANTTTRLVDFNLKFFLEFSDTFNTDTTSDYVWDTTGGYSYSWNSGGYVQITGSDNNNFSWNYYAGADNEEFPSSGTLRMVAKKTQDWPADNNGGLMVGRIDPTTSGTPTLTWTPRTYHYFAGLCGSSYTQQLYHRYNFTSSSDASSVNVPYKWDDQSAYHTFELVYTPTSMALYVDGSLNVSTSWTTSDYDTAAAGRPNFCGFEGSQMSMELTELTIEDGSPYS